MKTLAIAAVIWAFFGTIGLVVVGAWWLYTRKDQR